MTVFDKIPFFDNKVFMNTTNKKWVIGNFKQNPSDINAVQALVRQIKNGVHAIDCPCHIGIVPSFVHLSACDEIIQGSNIWLLSQDIAATNADTGAFTGDVSAMQVANLNAKLSLIGHSERRQYHSEDNATLSQKIRHAHAYNLGVVFCVGESYDDYKNGNAQAVLDKQLTVLDEFVADGSIANVMVAYEPVWAIGTGLTPTLDEVEAVHRHIKSKLPNTQVLYGGSVNDSNATALSTSPHIDGVLVGGASLDGAKFLAVVAAFSL